MRRGLLAFCVLSACSAPAPPPAPPPVPLRSRPLVMPKLHRTVPEANDAQLDSDGPAETPSRIKLAGVVLHDGQPVKGIEVSLGDEVVVRTDAQGHFEREVDVPSGLDRFDVWAEQGNRYASIGFAARDRLDLKLELTDRVPLTVTARDERGQPVSGVEVEVEMPDQNPIGDELDADGNEPKPTDAKGVAVLMLVPNTYRLIASWPQGPRAEVEELMLPKPGAAVSVTMKRWSLSGAITTRDGRGLEDVQPRLYQNGKELPVSIETTDSEGGFEVAGVATGDYELRAEVNNGTASVKVHVPQRGIKLVVDNGADVSGTVTGPDGKPSELGEVELANAAGEEVSMSFPREDGAFFFTVKPGAYRLIAFSDDRSASAALDIDLTTRKRQVVKLKLSAALKLRGTVADSNGTPAAGVMLCARPIAGRQRFFDDVCGKTDPEGKFVLGGVTPGKYQVRLSSDRYDAPSGWVAQTDAEAKLVVTELPSVRGRLLNAAGAPVSLGLVDGRQFENPEGKFQVWTRGTSPAIEVSGGALGDTLYVVPRDPKGVTELGDVKVSPARLTVTVLDALHRPLPGVWLSFARGGAPVALRGVLLTDVNGQAQLPRVIGTGLSVLAFGPHCPRMEKPLASDAASITLVAAPGALLSK